MARGKGVLFATGHLGNWELSAFSHAIMSAPMGVVVRPLDNPRLDAFVERRRGLSGNHLISKRDFARPILQALRRNEAVGILVDQNVVPGSRRVRRFLRQTRVQRNDVRQDRRPQRRRRDPGVRLLV